MRLTIVTDASVGKTSHNAGFAFYIGCKEYKLTKAGALRGKISNPNLAELYCIGNALLYATSCKLDKITSIAIHSDSLTSLALLTGILQPNSPEFAKGLKTANDLIARLGKPIAFKHVKAHTENTDKISVINAWCDSEAVKYRTQLDKQKK